MTKNSSPFPHLLSPITINGLTLRNRIVSSGHGTRLADGHAVSDRLLAYHEARAKGGCGLIITEAAMVDLESVASPTHLVVANDDIIPSLRRLSDRLHGQGCALVGQVFHLGLEMTNGADGRRAVAYGPSASPSERYHTAGRAMPTRQVREIVGMFGSAARRMKEGGMDGVEIAASHGYLVAQFLSPHLNRRDDEYGGSFTNRLRFLREIIAAIRDRIGPEPVLGMRISGDEMVAEGLDAEEVLEICRTVGSDGALDYFNVTAGSSRQAGAAVQIVPPMSTEIGLTAPFSAAIKKVVTQPTIAVGRINHAGTAEEIIATGQADLCGMTRAMITDPELGNKLMAGRAEEVRQCIACNQACIDRMHRGYGVSCIQHPETGRELIYDVPNSAAQRKRVMVVGGGPGGLKAAAVAAERGHEVTLYEKAKRLGGQALLAERLPRRAEFGGIVTNLQGELERSGAQVQCGVEVDRVLVERLAPDAVILATGATVRRPEMEGADEAHVLDAWQVLRDGANIGTEVVIADWRCDWIGLGLAEKLARDGCHVRLASTGHVAGESIPRYMRDLWLGDMHRLGVELVPLTRLFGVDGDTVYFQHVASGEPVIMEGIDTVVLSHGHDPLTDLEAQLEGWEGELHLVGDCLAPRTAEEAVLEGLEAAWRL